MIYIIPVIILFIGIINCDFNQRKGRVLWFVVYAVMSLLIGLRYKVGGDTYNYNNFFENSSDIYSWTPINLALFEPGFSYLTSIVKTYSESIYVYQIVIILIFNYLLFRFIRRNTEFKFSALLLIYITIYIYFGTEILRESISVGILLNAYDLIKEKRWLIYTALVVLATSFHSSGLIGIIFPFVAKLKFKYFLSYFIIWGLILIFIQAIMTYLSGFEILAKITRYSTHQYVGYLWSSFRLIYFGIIPLIFLSFFKKRNITIEFEGIICFQILLSIGLFIVPIIFQRLINYTILFYLVALVNQTIPSIVRRIKLNKKTLVSQFSIFILIITILAHSSYYIHLDFYKRWYPYHSILDPVEESSRLKYVPI